MREKKKVLVKIRYPHHKWKWKNQWSPLSIGRLVPNMITLAALCMGLSAIQFAFLRKWEYAVSSILIAGVFDGIDGRLARWLKVSSEFGAELDSLVDFINFGVAPSLVCYFVSLYQLGNKGWAACLFFSACMVLRLARFNIQRHHIGSPLFSVGVPAPAGALLALSPLIGGFVCECTLSPWIFFVMILFTSGMLISRYPTFVFKKFVIPETYRRLLLIGALIFVVCLVSAPWETLFFLSGMYLLSLPISGYAFYRQGLS